MIYALWLLMIICPLFIIAMVWIPALNKIWAKIVVTAITIYCVIMLCVAGVQYNTLEDTEWALDYSMDTQIDYLLCVEEANTTDDFWDCVIDYLDLLEEVFWD